MSAKKAPRPTPRDQIADHHADTPEAADRLLGRVIERIAELAPVPRSRMVVDLLVGENRVTTNLGRRAIGMTLTPTVADPTFAWAFAADGDKQAVISVLGVAQPGSVVEFF